MKVWPHPSGERPPSGKMTKFQPSATRSAASWADRRFTRARSMGMTASRNDHVAAFHVPVEEVIGGRRHHRPMAEPQGQAADQEGCVGVAGVVGGEDHRRREVARARPRRGPTGQPPDGRWAGPRCRAPWPGPGGRHSGGTRRCRSPRRAHCRARDGGWTPASRERRRGTSARRPRPRWRRARTVHAMPRAASARPSRRRHRPAPTGQGAANATVGG